MTNLNGSPSDNPQLPNTPPPIKRSAPKVSKLGPVAWGQKNLFNSWFNSILTVVLVVAIGRFVIGPGSGIRICETGHFMRCDDQDEPSPSEERRVDHVWTLQSLSEGQADKPIHDAHSMMPAEARGKINGPVKHDCRHNRPIGL